MHTRRMQSYLYGTDRLRFVNIINVFPLLCIDKVNIYKIRGTCTLLVKTATRENCNALVVQDRYPRIASDRQ